MIKHIIVFTMIGFQFSIAQESEFQNNKWSLGITYQPTLTGGQVTRMYEIDESDNYNYFYNFSTENKTTVYFTRSLKNNIWVYFSFDYSLIDNFYKNEVRKDYVGSNISDYDSGSKDTFKESSLSIFAGGKMFFKTPRPNTVSPYIVIGLGKQITYHSSESKDLFNSNQDDENVSGDTYDDYYGKTKSPISIFVKGGAEYYFNPSISITAELELLFEKSDGKRDYIYASVDDNGNVYYRKYYKIHKREIVVTQSAKIGLNFYF